ncbi:MAG: DUF3179 domain-containing protein [Bacteroidales bacterium]|nr:DUF3179 domain-containing protein [Bacteroidales bacterium]
MNKLIKAASVLILILITYSTFSQIKNPKNIKYNWRTDQTNTIIDPYEIQAVLPRRSFPKLDFPKFISNKEAESHYYKHEPVISIELNGEAKAYPLSILTLHEISNDVIGGVPILPAYCPLCNTAVVFDRRLKVAGEDYLLEFEVSGMLRNSNLIIYDFLTETWWQHLTGEAITGDFAGSKLTYIPSMIISYKEFFERYPAGKILSCKTGSKHEKRYGTNPYEKYDDETGIPYSRFFDEKNIDKRLPAMERIINIKDHEKYKIYPFSVIKKEEVINDKFKSKNIVIFYQNGTVSVLDNTIISKSKDVGSITVFNPKVNNEILIFKKAGNTFEDEQTNSEWDITGLCTKGELKGSQIKPVIHGNHFAFAWFAFYPESEIFTENKTD